MYFDFYHITKTITSVHSASIHPCISNMTCTLSLNFIPTPCCHFRNTDVAMPPHTTSSFHQTPYGHHNITPDTNLKHIRNDPSHFHFTSPLNLQFMNTPTHVRIHTHMCSPSTDSQACKEHCPTM